MPAGDTLTPVAHNATALDVTPEIRQTKFGDGYEQIAPKSINNTPRKYDLVWNNLSHTTGFTLHQFLDSHGKDQTWFFYRFASNHAYFAEGPRKFRVDTWHTDFENNFVSIKATIHEVFDLT